MVKGFKKLCLGLGFKTQADDFMLLIILMTVPDIMPTDDVITGQLRWR